MKISKSYIKQIIREELEELSQDQLIENQLVEEGFKEFGAAIIASLALAAGAQAKPVTITSDVNGVEKRYVVDAPDEASPEEIRQYLQKKASQRAGNDPAADRKAIFFSDVHDSTPEELAKLPMIKKSEDGGAKVQQPGGAQNTAQAARKSVGPQATEVSSSGNITVYKVTGAKDNSEATQAAMNAKMGGKSGQRVTFDGGAKAVPDGAGGYTVTLTGNVKENKLTKSSLKKLIEQQIEEEYGIAPDGIVTVTINGKSYEVEYDGEEAASTPTGNIYILSVDDIPMDNFINELEKAVAAELGRSKYD